MRWNLMAGLPVLLALGCYPLPLFDTEKVDGTLDQRINFKTLGLHFDSRADDTKTLTINDLPQYAEAVAATLLQSQVDYFEGEQPSRTVLR